MQTKIWNKLFYTSMLLFGFNLLFLLSLAPFYYKF